MFNSLKKATSDAQNWFSTFFIFFKHLTNFNLKKYRDLDLLDAPYLSCNFLSEGVYFSLSFPITKKETRMKIKFLQTRYLYNENFTEYDLKVIEFLSNFSFDLSDKILIKTRLKQLNI